MYGLLCKNTLKGMVLLFCVPWLLLGCGDFDKQYGAGGAADSGSLLNVERVIPNYFDEETNQVDVVQDNCAAPGDDPEPEDFSDTYAEIKMTNRPLPNATGKPPRIYLTSYEIHFTPGTQGTAPLLSFSEVPITETVGIEGCEPDSSCPEVSFMAKFVPLREKQVLYQYLVDNPAVYQLEYNVHYIFYGENDFGYPVSADGFSYFYALDYNNCSGG